MIMGDMVLRGRAGLPLAQTLSVVCVCNAQDGLFVEHVLVNMSTHVCVCVRTYVQIYEHYTTDVRVSRCTLL